MERDSLGLIETSGLVAAIEAADAGSKAANVTFRGYERARAGLITVVFLGDVAAVRAAVTAGSAAAKRIGTVISVHVIARPDRQLRVVANSAKPVDMLVSAPAPDRIALERPKTKAAGIKPVVAEAPKTEEGVAAFSSGAETPEVSQTQPELAQPVSEIFEEPAVEEPSHERSAEAAAQSEYVPDNDQVAMEAEAEEEVAVAAHVSTPHKKEKVRKPKSRRRV
ncbi:MAG TPA: BMC domain-containing protein [Terriglobales bacterium]|jgi:microcompartment protein CcmL/EutN